VHFTTIDGCTAARLHEDFPIIEVWNVDAEIVLPDATILSATEKRDSNTETSSSGERRHENQGRKESSLPATRSDDDPRHSFGGVELNLSSIDDGSGLHQRSVPTPGSQYKIQNNSPSHLQWISQVSRYSRLDGNYYSFNEYLYNDAADRGRPIIYVVDTMFLNTHEVIISCLHHLYMFAIYLSVDIFVLTLHVLSQSIRSHVVESIAVNFDGSQRVPQFDHPNYLMRTSHGTCMASLAAGTFSSAFKNARLVTVQLDHYLAGSTPKTMISRAILTFREIAVSIMQNKAQGNAVISMSWGMS
jgi:hypothetical protein